MAWHNQRMTWKTHLTDDERRALDYVEYQRDDARGHYNALRVRLKSVAERRMKKPDAGEGE
jgi:hypothetical protein